MALGADRYASRADTLLFVGCMLLSIAAMSLPDRWRDPLAKGLRQTVLAPFLWLQQQTGLLAAALSSYDAVVAQRDSATLAATFVPELRAENTRLRGLLGLGVRLASGYVPAEVLHEALPTNPLTLIVSAGRRPGGEALAGVGGPGGLGRVGRAGGARARALRPWERTYLVRPAVHPSAVSHVMILTGGRSGTPGDLRGVFERGEQGP